MRRRGEAGETLVEILVSTTLMGIIAIGIIGSIATVLISTDIDRKVSQAETVLRSYVAAIQDATYVDCGGTSAYSSVSVPKMPARFTATVEQVQYWKGDGPTVVPASNQAVTFDGACGTDQGLQSIDLRVESADKRAIETVTIYKRRTS